jgi:membrane protease YdiL (CAAX protease family)
MSTPNTGTTALVVQHLLPGAILVALFAAIAPLFQSAGIPTFAAILALEVFFLAPYVLWKLSRVARAEHGTANPLAALGFAPKPNYLSYLWVVPLGVVAAIGCFELLRAADEPLRQSIGAWLPGWHYAKDLERHEADTLLVLFCVAIVADGLIGPIVEELYFRGYLLPRMQHLGRWAPVLNGALFALYHFWQPMNYPSLLGASLVLAGFGWWRRDYRVPLLVHCTMNTLGHVLGVVGLLAPA